MAAATAAPKLAPARVPAADTILFMCLSAAAPNPTLTPAPTQDPITAEDLKQALIQDHMVVTLDSEVLMLPRPHTLALEAMAMAVNFPKLLHLHYIIYYLFRSFEFKYFFFIFLYHQ
jgi:hypothetical protein